MSINILTSIDLPDGFIYPEQYLKVIELHLINLVPWYIIDAENAKMRLDGMRKRYHYRQLIPFAERRDNDDVACFEVGKGDEVVIIHDFASPGFEQRQTYDSFWVWFRIAIDDMIDFD